MTTNDDQTTYISPDLQLAEDEDGNLDIIHGDTEVYILGPGLHPVTALLEEADRILAVDQDDAPVPYRPAV